VSGIGEEQGAVRQIETDHGPVTARMVIDATGRARHVARQLEIPFEARSPRLIARYGYVTGSCPARDDAPRISGDRSGWTWTAKIRNGLYQWTRVGFDDVAGDGWLPVEFQGMAPFSRTRGADVTWRIARRLAGPNWFLAGDAAATLDPTSSRGVLKSIMTGIMSSHVADAALRGKLTRDQAASSYHHWLLDWFEKDVSQMRQFYRLLDEPAQA
jgi:flavin-dependent dehydrogenase